MDELSLAELWEAFNLVRALKAAGYMMPELSYRSVM